MCEAWKPNLFGKLFEVVELGQTNFTQFTNSTNLPSFFERFQQAHDVLATRTEL